MTDTVLRHLGALRFYQLQIALILLLVPPVAYVWHKRGHRVSRRFIRKISVAAATIPLGGLMVWAVLMGIFPEKLTDAAVEVGITGIVVGWGGAEIMLDALGWLRPKMESEMDPFLDLDGSL